jgi:hypothetical protein
LIGGWGKGSDQDDKNSCRKIKNPYRKWGRDKLGGIFDIIIASSRKK